MRLLQFSASGFRSLADVKLDFEAAQATQVAVLRGKNGAGKSNVLRAIDLWFNLLWDGPRPRAKVNWPLSDLGLSVEDFCRQQPGQMRLSGKLTDLKVVLERSQLANPQGFQDVEAGFLISRNPEGVTIECERYLVNGKSLDQHFQHTPVFPLVDSWMTAVSDCLRHHAIKHIPAFRALAKESPNGNHLIRPRDLSIEHLQQFLLDAQHSPDPVLRGAYRKFQTFISGEPLRRGLLTVIKNEAGLSLVEERKLGDLTVELPVRSLGSGDQEILTLVGLTFLSGCAIVSIEEPEAHLHWTSQQVLREALGRLVQDDSVLPLQIILESHSHEFQYGDFFFEVTRDESSGLSSVVRKPNEEAYPHFNEPGPVRDALRALVGRLLRQEEVLYRTLGGQEVTAGQMLEWLERNDSRAKEFLDRTTRSVLLAMANEAQLRGGSTDGSH